MALAGVESRGLKSAFEDDVMDMAEGADGAGKRLLSAARQAAGWPEAATRELVRPPPPNTPPLPSPPLSRGASMTRPRQVPPKVEVVHCL